MAEAPGDWTVQVTLDRGLLAKDISTLVHVLARQRVAITLSALTRAEAEEKAREHLETYSGITMRYVKALNPRRLPT